MRMDKIRFFEFDVDVTTRYKQSWIKDSKESDMDATTRWELCSHPQRIFDPTKLISRS
jgi:hypothetical protein